MAGVAKWLRHRIVVPAYGGSTPLACPIYYQKQELTSVSLFDRLESDISVIRLLSLCVCSWVLKGKLAPAPFLRLLIAR